MTEYDTNNLTTVSAEMIKLILQQKDQIESAEKVASDAADKVRERSYASLDALSIPMSV